MLTLNYFNWTNLFEAVIGRESTPEHKESGVPAQMALEILNASPNTTIMIGDALMDYLAAKNAGIEKTVLVATGQIDSGALCSTSPYVIESLSDIEIIEL